MKGHDALLRMQEISSLVVQLKQRVKEYPDNARMIARLEKERIMLRQSFVKAIPDG